MSTAVLATSALYSDYVNPEWAKLLDLLEMNASYTRCEGAELHTAEGQRYLDFLSGYCVHNTGHNHPEIIAALKDELDQHGPAMLQSHVSGLAGELASRLCDLAGAKMQKVFFCSSGSEGVEAAIKFARAHTRRSGILYNDGAFHGLTCGALSLMGSPFWREGFGPLLPDTEAIPFNDLESLEHKLKTKRFAAFILEPIQSEAGIRIPDPHYLEQAAGLCRKYGTLFVLDEVQTGMYRTGKFLAAHHYGVEPDMIILAKALSGGLIPVGAVLLSDEIYKSTYTSLKRAIVHTSTFGENGLAMRAGLATLDVLQNERLGERATRLGARLRRDLSNALAEFEMVKDVRGLGMLNGIEFQRPSQLGLRLSFEAFGKIHAAMFGQMIVMRMFREEKFLTQVCGNNFNVLKVAPPLIADPDQLNQFVNSVARVVGLVHSSRAFWSDALSLARRAVNV